MSIFQLLLIIICCFEFDCEILVFSIDRCEKYMGNVNIRYCKNKVNDKLILEGQARRAIFTTIETSTEFTLKRKLLPHLTKIEIINGYCPHKIFTDFLVVVTGPDDDEMCEITELQSQTTVSMLKTITRTIQPPRTTGSSTVLVNT